MKPQIARRKFPGASLGGWVCALWAFFLCYQSGWRGFFAMDQSIVFDGGWRILQGQVPFVDFMLPHGPLSFWIQALFFRLLGVDYQAYVLTASLLNALASCLAFATFRNLAPTTPWAAWAAGLITGSWFYAPMGTPYIEQTSFLCLWLGVFCASRALAGTVRASYAWWGLAGLALAGAIVAKTNAGLLAVPSLLGMVLLAPQRIWPTRVVQGLTLAFGCAIGLGFFALWLLICSDPAAFTHHVFEVAGREGRRRLLENKPWFSVVYSLLSGKGNDLVRMTTVSAYVAAGWALVASLGPLRHLREATTLRFWAGLLLLWVPYQQAFGVTSNNNGLNEQPFIGLVFVSFLMILGTLVTARDQREFSSKTWPVFWRAGVWGLAGIALGVTGFFHARGVRGLGNFNFALGVILAGVFLALVTSAWAPRFSRLANCLLAGLFLGTIFLVGAWGSYSRQAQDFFNSRTRFVVGDGIPGLRGLAWAEGVNPDAVVMHPTWKDLVKIWSRLREAPGRFYLLGNHTFLYALAGKPSVGPLSWFFKGLTYSRQYDPAFDRAFAAEVDQPDMLFFVTEEDRGLAGKLGDFPQLEAVLRTQYRPEEKIGIFRIYRRISPADATTRSTSTMGSG